MRQGEEEEQKECGTRVGRILEIEVITWSEVKTLVQSEKNWYKLVHGQPLHHTAKGVKKISNFPDSCRFSETVSRPNKKLRRYILISDYPRYPGIYVNLHKTE